MSAPVSGSQYAFGHSNREMERLSHQAMLVAPFTRQLFLEAGLCAGMRVLDVGSGMGDVAMLAAEIVGEAGEVIGTDKAATAIAAAQSRVANRGFQNIRFLEGDPAEMVFGGHFDAVVGRFILCHCSKIVETLRSLARHAKPGGLVVFQEPDHTGAHSSIPIPLFSQGMKWLIDTIRATGREPDTGLRLYSAYLSAGLPAPRMRYDSLIATPSDWQSVSIGVETIRSYLPLMEKFGIATAAEVDIDTLEQRFVEHLKATGAVVVCPGTVGAWCQLPA